MYMYVDDSKTYVCSINASSTSNTYCFNAIDMFVQEGSFFVFFFNNDFCLLSCFGLLFNAVTWSHAITGTVLA